MFRKELFLVGRLSHKPVVWYKGFLYQAASWKTARRVVAKVRFYNKRGTAEQWIKEAVKLARLSCHRFRSNQVRLALSLLAYNLGNLWRRLALPRRIENWSLTSLQQRLVKTGGRLVKYARYYWLLLAEGHLTRRRFGAMLGRIALLPQSRASEGHCRSPRIIWAPASITSATVARGQPD